MAQKSTKKNDLIKPSSNNKSSSLSQMDDELNKYLDLIDLKSVSDNVLNDPSIVTDNTLSNMGQSISEIRVEMNILRKNLSTDIENMLKILTEDIREKLSHSILDAYSKVKLDMKNSQRIFISDMRNEIEKMKSEIKIAENSLKNKAEHLLNEVDSFTQRSEEKNGINFETEEKQKNENIINLDEGDYSSRILKLKQKIENLDRQI